MISKTTCAMLAAVMCAAATPAAAKCQKLAFLVNDYGKDGPTKDAKSLLDKYIVTWTKEKRMNCCIWCRSTRRLRSRNLSGGVATRNSWQATASPGGTRCLCAASSLLSTP